MLEAPLSKGSLQLDLFQGNSLTVTKPLNRPKFHFPLDHSEWALRGGCLRRIVTAVVLCVTCFFVGVSVASDSTAQSLLAVVGEQCTPPRLAQVSRDELRVGYSSFNLAGDKELLLPHLERVFSAERLGRPVVFTEYDEEHLQAAVEQNEVDAVLSSSGFYRKNTTNGLRSLATVVCDEQPDPNQNEGSLIIANADRLKGVIGEAALNDIARNIPLSALRSFSLVANSPESFSGYQTALREFVALSPNPEDFFSERHFYHEPLANDRILRAVAEGRADVGFLPLCSFEQLERQYPELVARVRIVNERVDDVTACRHSSTLYPSMTLSVTPSITASLSRELTVALLNEPKSVNGLMWGVASDFKGVDDLLRDLKLGPFEYLREWGLRRIWAQYRWVLVGAAVFIVLLLGHALRANVLVRRKEAEVRALLRTQSEQQAKYDRLQKAGAVGQISSLVAHELRQPLGAITLYTEGLLNLSRASRLTQLELEHVLGEIHQDARLASTIVERVRQYAKQDAPLEVVDLAEVLGHIERIVPKLDIGAVKLNVVLAADCSASVFCNRLELEMAILNLIKNAMEAALERHEGGSRVMVLLLRPADRPQSALIAVLDNGPDITEAEFAALNEPVSSLKPQGLGLGLAIAKNSVEALGGRIRFIRNRDWRALAESKSDQLDCAQSVTSLAETLNKWMRAQEQSALSLPATGLAALVELPLYRLEEE